MERVTGIEPAQPAWKAGTLPLSYTRTETLLWRPAEAAFCASGAHVLTYAARRFSKAAPADSPERVSDGPIAGHWAEVEGVRLETRSGESVSVIFENRSGAYLMYASTGSAEKRAEWPPERVYKWTPGGRGWIRTNVGVRQRIYSPPPLATRAPFRRRPFSASDLCCQRAGFRDSAAPWPINVLPTSSQARNLTGPATGRS